MNIKHLVKEKLKVVLSNFFEDFEDDNIKELTVWMDNKASLQNLKLRKDLFLKQSLPLVMNDSIIKSISVEFPLPYINKPIEIHVKGAYLFIRALSEIQRENLAKNQIEGESQMSFKQKKLLNWEQKIKKKFDSKEKMKSSFMENYLGKIVVKIEEVNIYFENLSVIGLPSVLKFSIGKMEIKNNNENPNENKEDKTVQFISKLIKLQKISVSLSYSDEKAPLHIKSHYNFCEKIYQQLRDKASYIFNPFDLELNIDYLKEQKKRELKINLLFQKPFILFLQKWQQKYLAHLGVYLRNLLTIQENLHLRPVTPVFRDPIAWFKYIVNAIIEDQRQRKFNLQNSTKKVLLIKKYVSLFKRKQNLVFFAFMKDPYFLVVSLE